MCRGKDHGDRRCGNDTSQARQRRRLAVKGQALYDATIEYARQADFMDVYVGREYVTSSHREVLSTGAEAMFHGNFGGFVGLDENYKADLDHRGFVLGVFATA